MPKLTIAYKRKMPGPDFESIDKIVGKKHIASLFGIGRQDVMYNFRSYADARIAMRAVVAARKNHTIYLPGLSTVITKTIRGENLEYYRVLTYEGRKMGTIEPIYVRGQPVREEHDAADHLAFIRGCIEKYRGKGVSDKNILDYVEEHV